MLYLPTLTCENQEQMEKLEKLNLKNGREKTNDDLWVKRFNRNLVHHLKESEEALYLILNDKK